MGNQLTFEELSAADVSLYSFGGLTEDSRYRDKRRYAPKRRHRGSGARDRDPPSVDDRYDQSDYDYEDSSGNSENSTDESSDNYHSREEDNYDDYTEASEMACASQTTSVAESRGKLASHSKVPLTRENLRSASLTRENLRSASHTRENLRSASHARENLRSGTSVVESLARLEDQHADYDQSPDDMNDNRSATTFSTITNTIATAEYIQPARTGVSNGTGRNSFLVNEQRHNHERIKGLMEQQKREEEKLQKELENLRLQKQRLMEETELEQQKLEAVRMEKHIDALRIERLESIRNGGRSPVRSEVSDQEEARQDFPRVLQERRKEEMRLKRLDAARLGVKIEDEQRDPVSSNVDEKGSFSEMKEKKLEAERMQRLDEARMLTASQSCLSSKYSINSKTSKRSKSSMQSHKSRSSQKKTNARPTDDVLSLKKERDIKELEPVQENALQEEEHVQQEDHVQQETPGPALQYNNAHTVNDDMTTLTNSVPMARLLNRELPDIERDNSTIATMDSEVDKKNVGSVSEASKSTKDRHGSHEEDVSDDAQPEVVQTQVTSDKPEEEDDLAANIDETIDMEFVQSYDNAFNMFLAAYPQFFNINPDFLHCLKIAKLQKMLDVMDQMEVEHTNQLESSQQLKKEMEEDYQVKLKEASREKATRSIQWQKELNKVKENYRSQLGSGTWALLTHSMGRASRLNNLRNQVMHTSSGTNASDLFALLPDASESQKFKDAMLVAPADELDEKEKQELQQLKVDNAFLNSEITVLEKKLTLQKAAAKKHGWVDTVLLRMDNKKLKKLKSRYEKRLGVSFNVQKA